MPTFEYTGINQAGERVTGTLLGSSMEQALSSLGLTGLKVERIHEAAFLNDPLSSPAPPPPVAPPVVEPASSVEPPRSETPYEQAEVRPPPVLHRRNYFATSILGPLIGRVPLTALAFFFRQFGTMMEAGVPIVQSLDTLSRQARNQKLAGILREMRRNAEAGVTPSATMQRYPEVFSVLSLSLVRAGEEGGFLAGAFKQLADYYDQEIRLRNMIRRLTFYPKMVLALSIVIVFATNWFIRYLGKSGGLTSPLTEWATWLVLGPVLIGIFLFFRVGLANPRVRFNWDLIGVSLPFTIGTTVRQLAMARFGRAFAALHRGGVPIHRSIELSADSCGNEYLRSRIRPASRRLESGAGITETLRESHAFTPIVLDMVETGERTGNMESMLDRLADFYEDEGQVGAHRLANVFGILFYLATALYVLYVLIQFWTGYAHQAVGGEDG